MMMRNIPFNAPGNPGADQAYQRRFDDVLTVNEIISVALIDGFEEASANLRQNRQADVLVLQVNNPVVLVRFDVG